MKRIILTTLTLLSLAFVASPRAAETGSSGSDRFYGKVTAIDHGQRSVTVHNAKQKADATFAWDETTKLTNNKKSMPASDLKIGQSLIVSYVVDNNVNRAQKITVRTPFKKASAD